MPSDVPRPYSLGGVVRTLRLKQQLTQTQLAERIGVTAQTVSNLERGETERLNGDAITRLADVLGVSVGELDPSRLAESVAERANTPARRAAIEQLLSLPDSDVEEILRAMRERDASRKKRPKRGRR